MSITGEATRLTRLVAAEGLAFAQAGTRPPWLSPDVGTEDAEHVFRAILRERDLKAAALSAAVGEAETAEVMLSVSGEVIRVRDDIERDLRAEISREDQSPEN